MNYFIYLKKLKVMCTREVLNKKTCCGSWHSMALDQNTTVLWMKQLNGIFNSKIIQQVAVEGYE